MRTRFDIEIDGVKTEVPSECFANWDEIQCSYKRSDFSGVIRSFTTQFEFVGAVYDKLLAIYMRDGVNAHAVLTLYTVTESWTWLERFSCELDFSSLEWDNYVAKINCVDDSLGSIIKARKGTKYEFEVGRDIPVTDTLQYDRIKMSNTVTHEIMSNGDDSSAQDGSVALVPTGSSPITSLLRWKRVPTYVIGDAESYENSSVIFDDESDTSGSYFLKVLKPTKDLSLDIEIDFFGERQPHTDLITEMEIRLVGFDNDNPDVNSNYLNQFNLGTVLKINETNLTDPDRVCLGCFPSVEVLERAYPNPPQDVYAIIGESNSVRDCQGVYLSPVTNGVPTSWIQAKGTITGGRDGWYVTCVEHYFRSHFDLSEIAGGTMFALIYRLRRQGVSDYQDPCVFVKSKITAKWSSRAKAITIDALQPSRVLNAILNRMADNKLNVESEISGSDSRIADTYLFAAESIRAIPGAKLYTSFSDFCEWMEAVFGYTYYLGPLVKAQFERTQPYSGIVALGADHLLHTKCPTAYDKRVMRIRDTPYFAVLSTTLNEDGTQNYYTKWDGSDSYNDITTTKARLDTLFYTESDKGVYFDSEYKLKSFEGDVNRGLFGSQTVYFVPRSEIFAGYKTVLLSDIKDLRYTINSAIAYSALTVGYEKQDYEAECGRDEWNFSIQYTTDINRLDKKLILQSKYRADCYGFEFLAQERNKDTTDNNSDSTVFFVYCKSKGPTSSPEAGISAIRILECGRSSKIEGTMNDSVFNGEYAPIKCVDSNASYISAALSPMAVKFASCDGNPDVVIDGVRMNADLNLNEQLFTLGELEFSSSDVDVDLDINALYKVRSGGRIYSGFLKEVSFRYARPQAAKYKLIIKEVTNDN